MTASQTEKNLLLILTNVLLLLKPNCRQDANPEFCCGLCRPPIHLDHLTVTPVRFVNAVFHSVREKWCTRDSHAEKNLKFLSMYTNLTFHGCFMNCRDTSYMTINNFTQITFYTYLYIPIAQKAFVHADKSIFLSEDTIPQFMMET